ncbi:MAG: MATE family efflux transporter [Acidaminobacteraceae bacterium]
MEFKSNKSYFKEYSLTLIVKNVIMGLMLAADKIIGTIFIGVNALVATNLIGPLQVIIYAISALFMGGLGSYVGLLLGRKDVEKANRATSMTMLVLTGLMSIITLLIVMNPDKIAYFVGARGDILEITSSYLYYVSWGFIPMVLAAAIDIVIMNDGSPKFIMKVNLFSTVLNLMLNLIFVVLLKWGIIGLAVATTISNLIHLIISVYYYIFKCKTLKFVAPKFDLEILIRILYNGSSDFIGMFSEGLKRYVINIAIISFLTVKHMEAYSMVSMFIIIFISSVFYGTAQGMQPIFSNMMGAKKFDRLKPLLNYSVRKSNIIALAIFIIAIPFMKIVFGFFLNDPETIKIGFYIYLTYGLATLFENLPNAAIMFFTAINRPLESIVFSVSRTVFLLPILTYFSIYALGQSGLMIGTLLAEGIMIIASIKYLKSLAFEKMRIVE